MNNKKTRLQNINIQPLADKIRPKNLREFVGQKHLIGRGKPLEQQIRKGQVSSMILWGPPGSGKTTLARIIANYTKSYFVQFSAVTSGVDQVRKTMAEAQERQKAFNQRTILFVDEIHRFNKAQQDAFLPYVEKGTIILIGATTENPGFEVNAPLISRSQVYVLYPLTNQEINILLARALKRFYPKTKIDSTALKHIIISSNGDARVALNALELAASISNKITLKIAEEAVQKKAIYYDKKGDWHYDVISAFIKSLRGSDPDAALHWLARMIKAGEDPIFIARRMVIFASEDIGNALPTALVVATNCMQAVHMIGMPEAQLILAQTAIYLARAPKSRASTEAIFAALSDIDEKQLEPVPLHLRNPVNIVMKKLGAGKGYKWTDQSEFYKKMEFMPKNLKNRKYYNFRRDKK